MHGYRERAGPASRDNCQAMGHGIFADTRDAAGKVAVLAVVLLMSVPASGKDHAVEAGVQAGESAATSPAARERRGEPELIFKRSTVWKFLTPDHKLATYAIDDPIIDGVSCHFTVPEKGGLSGLLGVAEELSDASLACRQVGPVRFFEKFGQGSEVFRKRRSILFKKMRIVRGCDQTRNVLVYLSYTDKLIEGSPKNSTSSVPIMPWGTIEAPRCADWLDE